MDRKKSLGLLFVVSLVATMTFTSLRGAGPDGLGGEAAIPGAGDAADASGERDDAGRRQARAASVRTPEEDRELQQRLVMMLAQLYGDRISSTAAQVMMAQVRTQVLTLFPGDGARRFREILEEAFPGRSREILATLGKVDDFDTWLAENEERLAAMSPEEREKAVADHKKELFGEEGAAELDAEARANEERGRAVSETVRAIEESPDMSLDDKVEAWAGALDKALGEGASVVALESPSIKAQAFFGLESVSRQLGELDPEARQRKINEIRRGFGYDEEQVAALEADDREREADWQNGYGYMDERRALESRYSGAELERELAALRERRFGDLARAIEIEEKDGFFRFERPRLYGRN